MSVIKIRARHDDNSINDIFSLDNETGELRLSGWYSNEKFEEFLNKKNLSENWKQKS